MKYTGFNGVAAHKLSGTERFVELARKHHGFNNLGTLNVRLMRSAPKGTKPNDPKWMSIHATGRALDIGFAKDNPNMPEGHHQAVAKAFMEWCVKNYKTLGIEEVHDYRGLTKKGCEKWGRGWRCSRAGKPGWKDWSDTDNGGTPGAWWIHIELAPEMAKDDTAVELAWKALPKAVWNAAAD